MLENGLTQFMQFRAQAAQAAHAVHASAAAAQAEHLLRNIGKFNAKNQVFRFNSGVTFPSLTSLTTNTF